MDPKEPPDAPLDVVDEEMPAEPPAPVTHETVTRPVVPDRPVPRKKTSVSAGSIDAERPSEQDEKLLAVHAQEGEPHASSRRHGAGWMPWAVVGTGAAVVAAGGVLYWQAAMGYDEFDNEFDAICRSGGCYDAEVPYLSDRLHRAEWKEQTAKISFGVGGAALAAGLAIMLFDHRGPVREQHDGLAGMSLAPVLAPGTAGVTAGISF